MKKALFAVAMTLAVSSMAFGALKTETFDTDPGWQYYSTQGAEGVVWGTTVGGTNWVNSNLAGGAAAGEAQSYYGWADSYSQDIVYYGDYAAQGVTGADVLHFDGKLYADKPFGNAGSNAIGWFGEDESFFGIQYDGSGKFQIWWVDGNDNTSGWSHSGGTSVHLDYSGSQEVYIDSIAVDVAFDFDPNTMMATFDVSTGGTTVNTSLDMSGMPILDQTFDVFGTGQQKMSTGGAPGRVVIDDFTYTVVPEPATMSLLGLGGLGALIRRRR